jgi:hypothetical protein
VIKVPPKDVEHVRFPLLKRNYFVFFDDLNKFSDVNFDFNLFLKKIKAKSKDLIVVSTCRSGDEYISVKDKSMQFLKSTFTTVVNLDEYELNKSEGEELAREAGVTWKPDQFLGTPGSVLLDIDDMRNRYRNSGAYEKSIYTRDEDKCEEFIPVLKSTLCQLLHPVVLSFPPCVTNFSKRSTKSAYTLSRSSLLFKAFSASFASS